MSEKEQLSCDVKNIGRINAVEFEGVSEVLSALSNKFRLSILDKIMKYGEVCACELESASGLAQPTVTSHLHRLYNAGIIVKREAWKYTYFSLNERFRPFIEEILGSGSNGSITQHTEK